MKALVRPVVCLLLLPLAAASALHGQRRAPAWPSEPVAQLPGTAIASFSSGSTRSLPQPDTYPRTYWKEGGIVGGILLGIAGALLVHGLCEDSDNAEEHCGTKGLGGATLGAGLGFAIGSLIGGQFHKGS